MPETKVASAKYIVTLAIASILILVVGALLRPEPRAPEQPQVLPSESELALLTRLTQRRSIDTTVDYFAHVADDAAAAVVRVSDTGASGIIWRPDTIATARLERTFPTTLDVRMANATALATGTTWAPHVAAASAALPESSASVPARRRATPNRAGDWLVVVWQTDTGRAFAPATFLDAAPMVCDEWPSLEIHASLAFSRSMAGGGVFDLDGNLIALVLPCGERYAAVDVERVDAMLAEADSFRGRLLAAHGVTVGAMTDAESSYFGVAAGVVVREVWIGLDADRSGLRPGDVIVAVNDSPVTSPDGLRPLLSSAPSQRIVLTVKREGARDDVAMTLGTDTTEPPATDISPLGLMWNAPRPGVAIDAVAAGSRAAAAGLQPGDRLSRIGRVEPRTIEQVRRALESQPPVTFIELERNGRRRGTLVRLVEP